MPNLPTIPEHPGQPKQLLLLGLVSFLSFLGVGWAWKSLGWVDRCDKETTLRIYTFAASHPWLQEMYARTTDFGSGRLREIVAIVVACLLVVFGRRLWGPTDKGNRAAIWKRVFLLAWWWVIQYGSRELSSLAKRAYGRPRPFIEGSPFAIPDNPSFPSGHSLGAMVTYALIAYLFALRWPRVQWVAAIGAGLIILHIGFTRLALGVHYLTDVLGGFLLGLSWVALGMAILEWRISHTQFKTERAKEEFR